MLQSAVGAFGQTNVWMLVPGFTVQALPVKLANVNNLRFSPKGKLTALGYDGRVHILQDTDGDGLEDRVSPFWDKDTLRVPVGMAWAKEGLYVSSQGKVSLLKDTDQDGKADAEEIVASGWPPTDVPAGGVDATAVTLDDEGNLCFGLLTADYSNPYRVKDGVSRYDLKGKRGTIQKWHCATKQLETIATGIRVPYTLAFNRYGDLFVTDQEGETWCPDGNPLDELNHILPGRNYGFPPRHEKYLPDLVSEAPVVSFGPQHQSACGMVFNERKPNQKPFGPPAWENDALVAGESRGKIWRVPLNKTATGYTGRAITIARLNMLTTDVAISPKGELYVSCHSGPPDWGTGPKGEGKLFKITYTNPDAPQPTNIWVAASNEVRIAFDKPLDPNVANHALRGRIEFGQYVSAADRLEVLKPPYKVIKQQAAAPRGSLRVKSTKVDSRELILETDLHAEPLNYALYVPGLEIDLEYDLGVKAREGERPREPIQLTGGDYERGRSLFFGERLKCGSCHKIRDKGGSVGPDLSNLVHRDGESVLRDIRDPNALINPDHVAYNVNLRDGDGLSGLLKSEDEETVRLVAADGKEYAYEPGVIASLQPSAVSLMPSGLLDGLEEARVRDLLTFLLHEAPKRSPSEARSFLRGTGETAPSHERHITIVLVASKQDHGPGQHDYPAWQGEWNKLLSKATNVTVANAWEWPSAEQFSTADVIVFYYWNHNWNAERYSQVDAFLARGGGMALFHSATIADTEPEKLAERIGLAAQPKTVKYLHTPFTLKFTAPRDHPITRGFKELELLDEPYWPMVGDPRRVEVLATCDVEGEARPLVWTYQKRPGRVFVSIPGHYTWTLDDPLFRILALRAIAWAAGENPSRFEAL